MPSSKPARAEKRNKLITVQRLRRGTAPNAGGHVDESDDTNWEDFCKVWANVSPRGSREFFRREQVAADITHQVEILYSAKANQITSGMRVTFSGRKLNISGPPRNTDEANHSLVMACIEVP